MKLPAIKCRLLDVLALPALTELSCEIDDDSGVYAELFQGLQTARFLQRVRLYLNLLDVDEK